MALFKKKEKQEKPAASAAATERVQPKPPKPIVPPDVYTLLVGLAALCLIVATVVLGLNYYWYQTVDPAVIPLNWAR